MGSRLMPSKAELGSMFNGPMSSATRFMEGGKGDGFPNPRGLRTVMGFLLPEWQRGLVWSDAQCVSFMESVWRGIPIGSYTVNMLIGSRFDGYLIDGQQRMNAIKRYLAGELKVFGYYWHEVTATDRRFFDTGCIFPYYETRSNDEEYLRSYYNLMNFGGTPHKEIELA